MSTCIASRPADLVSFVRGLPTLEREVYQQAGYAVRFGAGERPACVIVDVEYNFTGDDPDEDILSSIGKYSNSCGPYAWAAVPRLRVLLNAFRMQALPVVFSHGRERSDTVRSPRLGTAIVDELSPREGELVIAKDVASAFFETDLASYLHERDVDTVIVTGCVTSGCVRATVVDAASHNFKVIVVEECVFDRALSPHVANLFDMDAKYADVLSLAETLNYLGGLTSAVMENRNQSDA